VIRRDAKFSGHIRARLGCEGQAGVHKALGSFGGVCLRCPDDRLGLVWQVVASGGVSVRKFGDGLRGGLVRSVWTSV